MGGLGGKPCFEAVQGFGISGFAGLEDAGVRTYFAFMILRRYSLSSLAFIEKVRRRSWGQCAKQRDAHATV